MVRWWPLLLLRYGHTGHEISRSLSRSVRALCLQPQSGGGAAECLLWVSFGCICSTYSVGVLLRVLLSIILPAFLLRRASVYGVGAKDEEANAEMIRMHYRW